MLKQPRTYWTALATERRSEGLARKSLVELGLEAVNFQYRGRAVGGVRPVLPLFEGYLLYRHDPRRVELGRVARSRGVRCLLVGVIPKSEIECLRGMIGGDGYIRLEGEEPPAFGLHDLVRATKGAFRDQTGEYRGVDQDNARRARVAFELLGCETISSILRYDLAPALSR